MYDNKNTTQRVTHYKIANRQLVMTSDNYVM